MRPIRSRLSAPTKVWVEKLNRDWIELLVTFQGWRQCRLLSADSFASLARDCGMNIWSNDLQALERRGLFIPALRTRSPVFVEKVEHVGDGFRLLGVLGSEEEWAGATRDTFGEMPWTKEQIPEWHADGFAWDPATTPFRPWSSEHGAFGGPRDRAFYSRFQLAELARLLDAVTLTVRLDSWSNLSQAAASARGRSIADDAAASVRAVKRLRPEQTALPRLCQLLAPRYFPSASGDGRSITVRQEDGWEYWEHRRAWSPEAALEKLGVTLDGLREIHEQLIDEALSRDELLPWFELISTMPQGQRTALRSRHRIAFIAHEMECMVRLLVGDLGGKHLTPPALSRGFRGQPLEPLDERAATVRRRFIGNRFGANPNPRLILVVEGDGESDQVPRLFAGFLGHTTDAMEIAVFPLKGISNATAGQRTALRLLIDERHFRDTLVFVMLDNENGASGIPAAVARSPSVHCPWRTVSREDYFHIWSTNIEWSNFTDTEIAMSLTSLTSGKVQFLSAEVADVRSQIADPEQAGVLLRDFFESRSGRRLKRGKRRLLALLCDQLLAKVQDPSLRASVLERPIIKTLEHVAALARGNFPPSNERTWRHNQTSGFFGANIGAPPWTIETNDK